MLAAVTQLICSPYGERTASTLSGISAGMMCWLSDGITDSFPGHRILNGGLGLLPQSGCPHWTGQDSKSEVYKKAIKDGMQDGWALPDGVALHCINEQPIHCVSSRPDVVGWQLSNIDGKVIERAIKTR